MFKLTVPVLYEEINFEELLDRKLDRLTGNYQEVNPDYERPSIADPAYHAVAEVCFSETLLRERINYASLQSTIKFSDHIVNILSGKLKDGETIEEYRERLKRDIASASSCGTKASYEALAVAAGQLENVKAVDAKAINRNGYIVIYVQPNTLDSELHTELRLAISEYFTRDDVHGFLDSVQIRIAQGIPVTISAMFTLEPGVSAIITDEIALDFRKAWDEKSDLSWNPSLSWIYGKLDREGIHLVEPHIDVMVDGVIPLQENQYPYIAELQFEVKRL